VIRSLLQLIFTISLFIFMVGNLSAMGLQLRVAEACAPLKNARFVVATLVGGFVIGPALAYLVVLAIPMPPPYATGVLLLGMAPSAPFLPLVVRKANGDPAAAAGVMLLASLGTILIMPLGVPLVAVGLSASAWSIAKPLLSMILLPLALGILIKSRWDRAAERIYKYVKGITGIGTIVFLLMVLILHFKAFLGSVGSHALLAQLVYVPALGVAGYMIGAGMPESRRSVMSLGMCTRNIGAAAAIVGANGDQRIMVSLVIATLVTVAFSFAAAPWFSRATAKAVQQAGSQGRVQLQPRQ
jgi:bile acid:Na+ symporter, BASS family